MKKLLLIVLCLALFFSCSDVSPVTQKAEIEETQKSEQNKVTFVAQVTEEADELEEIDFNDLIEFYYQCLKQQNQSLTLSQAKSTLLTSGLLTNKLDLDKETAENYNRASKILKFYNSALKDDFTHLYHPYADQTTKDNEMLEGLPEDNSLCIMLFGNRLDTTRESLMSDKFIARCETALDMAEKYPNALIMITGGHTGGDENPSEAEVGRDWLIANGVDEDRIVIDPLSWDSFANVMCSLSFSELRNHKEIREIVVVSSDYHVKKCSILLMTYIFAFGMDLPESVAGRGYSYGGNLGAVLAN